MARALTPCTRTPLQRDFKSETIGAEPVMATVGRRDHEKHYALFKLESAEGSEPHALGDLGFYPLASVDELWSWSLGNAIFSTTGKLAWHSRFDSWHCVSRIGGKRIRTEGQHNTIIMRRTPNHSTERTRASRSDHHEFVSRWRLVRAAHAGRWPLCA